MLIAVDAAVRQLAPLAAVIKATTEEAVGIEIPMVRGDTRPVLEFTVKDQNGTVINLTSSTQTFRIRRRGQTAVLIERACVISDAVNGKTRFSWQAADWPTGKIDKAGIYDGELEVVFSDSTIGTVYELYDVIVREPVA